MIETVFPSHRITVHFEHFDQLPEGKYVAWIDGEDYKGVTVSANSIGECVKELGISLIVLEHYRKNLKNKNGKF